MGGRVPLACLSRLHTVACCASAVLCVLNRRSGSPQINNAVLIILSHLVPEHARFDDSTSGGVTVAPAADHLHENDVLGTAEELKSVQEEAGARWRAKQLE